MLKELKVFARDSTQWSQLVMLAVLMVVYVANVRYLPLSGDGLTALLRNLATMTRVGVFEDTQQVKAISERLTDKAALKKARVHPIAVLAA